MIRLIARLDIKGPNLIKGIHMEGLRIVGDPQRFAEKYYFDGADELIYMDTVASLYGRNNLTDIVQHAARNIFIPLTVGGGIRSIDDVQVLLASGADKIAINSAAISNPKLITEIANRFGSQCIVVSVECKKNPHGGWEAYKDNGRERTGKDAIEWTKQAVELGAGEVLVTSIDQEGTRKGFDVALVQAVTNAVNVPVIASGGMGNVDHLISVIHEGGADAVAMADVLHYQRLDFQTLRKAIMKRGIRVRPA